MIIDSNYLPIPDNWQPPEWLSPPVDLKEPPDSFVSKIQRFGNFCKQNIGTICNIAYLAFAFNNHEYSIHNGCKHLVGIAVLNGLINWGEYRQCDQLTSDYVIKELKKNPFVAQVLDKPDSPIKKIEFVSIDHFLVNGEDLSDSYAHCHWRSENSCNIKVLCGETRIESYFDYLKYKFTKESKKLNDERNRMLRMTIFEIMNSNNLFRFSQTIEAHLNGLMSREEYARVLEFCEQETCFQCDQALTWGVENLGWDKLMPRTYWNFYKTPRLDFFKKYMWWSSNCHKAGKISHAEYYRRQWECFAIYYYYNQPEKIESEEFKEYLRSANSDSGIELFNELGKRFDHSVPSAIALYCLGNPKFPEQSRWLGMFKVCCEMGLTIKNSLSDEEKRPFIAMANSHRSSAANDPQEAFLYNQIAMQMYLSIKEDSLTEEDRRGLEQCQTFNRGSS